MIKKSLLFINGIPPENLPKTEGYDLIACTDGAFHYLKKENFPLEKLDFISGDFDSHSGEGEILTHAQNDNFEIIFTPDQNKTDFEKALKIIKEKGFKKVDVYGGSGGEMDHFLGNLTAAFLFKEEMEIVFFDEFSSYFFSPKKLVLHHVKGKKISLYPFPTAGKLVTKGLKWSLNQENLDLTQKIGTRNVADEDEVSIEFETGDLVVFVEL